MKANCSRRYAFSDPASIPCHFLSGKSSHLHCEANVYIAVQLSAHNFGAGPAKHGGRDAKSLLAQPLVVREADPGLPPISRSLKSTTCNTATSHSRTVGRTRLGERVRPALFMPLPDL